MWLRDRHSLAITFLSNHFYLVHLLFLRGSECLGTRAGTSHFEAMRSHPQARKAGLSSPSESWHGLPRSARKPKPAPAGHNLEGYHFPSSTGSHSRVAPRRSGARRAGETRVAAPRVAAHTRRCRLRPASPASRAQLIRAALKAQCLGPAEPHAARARCPRAADPGPGRAPWAVRARAPGGQREAGRTARCCGAKSGAAPQRPWRSTSRPFATRTAIWSAATR